MSLCRNYCYQSQTAVEILTLLVARGGNFLPTFSPSALDFKNTHYLCLTAPPVPLHIHLLQDKQCQKQEGKKLVLPAKLATQHKVGEAWFSVLSCVCLGCPTQTQICCVLRQKHHKWAAVSARVGVLALFYLKSNICWKKAPNSCSVLSLHQASGVCLDVMFS